MRRASNYDPTNAIMRARSAPFALLFAVLAFGTAWGIEHIKWYWALLAALAVFCAILFIPVMLADKSSDAATSLYTPTGASTPAIRQYSLADSLVARGSLAEAAEAYRLLAEDHPDDPQPVVRRARLLRDQLKQYDVAADWFKRALAIKTIDPQSEKAWLRELCELYTHKLKQPSKSLPYLKRLMEKSPRSPDGMWARSEYAEIKREIAAANRGEEAKQDGERRV